MIEGRRVLFFIDRSFGPTTETLLGFNSVAQVQDWVVYRPRYDIEGVIEIWRPHGIILGPSVSPSHVTNWEGPVVAIGTDLSARGIPSVGTDEYRIGMQAAEHLLETGAQHFAYFGDPIPPFSQVRMQGFHDRLARNKMRCSLWWEHHSFRVADPWSPNSLEVWLRTMQLPMAIFAGCDSWAGALSRACYQSGVRVPEDVMILGADNDELECSLGHPPLSSIARPWRRMGEEAARMLERAMAQKCQKDERMILPPMVVVPRQSTDMVAVEDPYVAAALQIIRKHANKPLTVGDILREVPTFQHKLERGFRRYVGRPMLAEIRRMHVEHAKRLLSTTDLSVEEVAHNSGFASVTKLGVAFRRETGLTPSAYRKSARR